MKNDREKAQRERWAHTTPRQRQLHTAPARKALAKKHRQGLIMKSLKLPLMKWEKQIARLQRHLARVFRARSL